MARVRRVDHDVIAAAVLLQRQHQQPRDERRVGKRDLCRAVKYEDPVM